MGNFAQNFTKFVRKSTGIPVSTGIAPTKTFAKIASIYAKSTKVMEEYVNGYAGEKH